MVGLRKCHLLQSKHRWKSNKMQGSEKPRA